LPDIKDYSMNNRTYRYFKGTPTFSFGHGLTYSDIEETWLDNNTVRIFNKGKYSTSYSVIQYENLSLKNFEKIYIESGECITINF